MGSLREDVDELRIKVEALKMELASIRQLAMEGRVLAEVVKGRVENIGSFQYNLGSAPITPQYDPLAALTPEPRRFDAEMEDPSMKENMEKLEKAESLLKLSPFNLGRKDELVSRKGVTLGSSGFGDDIEGEEDSRLVGG